ncbi:hypothetical protein [Methylobacterium organophilum]|uniref:DUF4393 domain-containing protein n=1 Tax=Methylobacterium organophilum TaxID=410 RepID=A0ABQ4TCW1_METOR|nr:hypothetical protein [Methylobacterium organophilum]GJE29536.1 hypothetical protein LKMONMHP_4418 [Methylobacterium organophilum]
MSDEKPKKVDPAYPSSDGLSKAGEMAMGTIGAAAGLVVPVVGPAAVQAILKNAVRLPMEVRRNNWFNSIGEGLRELQDRLDGFDPNHLGENEEFVSIVFETTQMAMKTHRAEKLEALRNVVLNTAAGVQIDDVLRGAFLVYVDRFSGLHLRVLKMLSNPAAVPAMVARAENMMMGSLSTVLFAALPEIGENERLLRRVVKDLEDEGLTDGAALNTTMSGGGLLAKRSTAEGDGFLRFISEPASGPT